MRNLVYNFADGRQVLTYAEAVAIATAEKIPFVADVVTVAETRKVENPGLREKYRKYFTK